MASIVTTALEVDELCPKLAIDSGVFLKCSLSSVPTALAGLFGKPLQNPPRVTEPGVIRGSESIECAEDVADRCACRYPSAYPEPHLTMPYLTRIGECRQE